MKYMSPRKSVVRAFLFVLMAVLSVSFAASAQSRRSKAADSKNSKAKKTTASAKDTKKTSKKETSKKDTSRKKDSAHTANAKDKRSSAKDKKEKATAKNDRSNSTSKGRAESRRAAAERKRVEAERRAAALAEQRRREQAAREARARKLAFERGLREETVANIASDVTDGEDLNIRRAAVTALGGHAGSVVVMEAQTGKVLTIVNQNWAVRDSIKPCSTIKLVTGVAGLNEGVIDKSDGSIRNVTTRRKLDDAVAFSDNGYFQRVGLNVGNSKMIEYARDLGLGETTGINMDGESPGRLAIGNNNARIYSHGDDFEVTGLQLAVLVSEITNGGHRVLPRIPRNAMEKTRFQGFYKADLNLPQNNVRRMIPGMMGAAEYGTARRGMNQDLGVAGKTGSCISKGSWVGLFASVAPVEQPKYAVVVITRGQSERGRYAAGVAAQIYSALANGITRTDRDLARREFNIAPRNVAAAKPAAVSDDDDDDSDSVVAGQPGDQPDGSEDMTGRGIVVIPSAGRTPVTPPKLVKRTGDSKPLFPPVVITREDVSKKKRPRVVEQ